jgi:hypothetical protein
VAIACPLRGIFATFGEEGSDPVPKDDCFVKSYQNFAVVHQVYRKFLEAIALYFRR